MEEKNKYKKLILSALYGGILLVMILPFLQKQFHLIEIKPLRGAIENVESPQLTTEAWLKGDFQKSKEKYINHSFGFRPLFVRLHNQYYYSFFNTAKANGVLIGKDNYLYEENYIKAYFGTDFIGEKAIAEKVNKLQDLSDTLNSKGIKLIVLLAPGKGSYFPEYFPSAYESTKKSTTNFNVYKEKLKQSSVDWLDFHTWFEEMKDTSSYELFPKTGIHWSKYAEIIVADSLLKKIEQSTQRPMPKIVVSKVDRNKHAWDTDQDIEDGMNLLFDIEDNEMGYPAYQIVSSKEVQPIKVLTVADSYYWGLFNRGFSKDLFGNGQFWFYNEQIYPDSYVAPLNVSDIDLISEVEKNKVILLISTDANLYKFAFGFIDDLHDAYFSIKLKE